MHFQHRDYTYTEIPVERKGYGTNVQQQELKKIQQAEKCQTVLPENELVYNILPKKTAGLEGCQPATSAIINILDPSLVVTKHFNESKLMKWRSAYYLSLSFIWSELRDFNPFR